MAARAGHRAGAAAGGRPADDPGLRAVVAERPGGLAASLALLGDELRARLAENAWVVENPRTPIIVSMTTVKRLKTPAIDDERQRTEENLHEERAKADGLLRGKADPPSGESCEEASEALDVERDNVDAKLATTSRTILQAVAAERERADETIALERERSSDLERLERERSTSEQSALADERLRTDASLVKERETTDATIVAQAERLQIVSHDLKNPLQSILANVAVIQRAASPDGSADPQQVQKLAARVERGAQAMDRLIGDLLTSTSLELGVLPLKLEPHDLAGVVEEVLRTLEPLAAEKDLRFGGRLPDAPLQVRCDAGRVSQALTNVVANAIKFTPEGGVVEVAVEREADEVRLTVLDSGPGVADCDAPHIFDRHFRGSAHPVGIGLGLYIAKTIVDLHGGRIWCERRKEARGSIFVITLPLVAV